MLEYFFAQNRTRKKNQFLKMFVLAMYRLHFTYPFTTFQYYESNLVKTKISLLAMHHECMPVYTSTQYHATYYAPYEFS